MSKSHIGLTGPYMVCKDTLGEIWVVDTRVSPPYRAMRCNDATKALQFADSVNWRVRAAEEQAWKQRAS